MSLSNRELETIGAAGSSADQSVRSRAVAVVLAQQGADQHTARRALAESYLTSTVPSFHLVPRGEAMLPEDGFAASYAVLAEGTNGFTAVDSATLATILGSHPRALAPLRMIAGLTYNELAVAIQLSSGEVVSGGALRQYEREDRPPSPESRRWERRERVLRLAAGAIADVVDRRILEVPVQARVWFHSKLDKRDTFEGWGGVVRDARSGVPYSALLYQRYVGGVWRQVQDAYSEIKGDAILELPLQALLDEARVPYWRSPRGASGARLTAERFGIDPGPDFLIPDESPVAIVESKVGEDGGTVRDKAARIQRLGVLASQRGLVLCAVVDGKGWGERPTALADVIVATSGRTFTLSTIRYLLEVPEIAAWRGRDRR